MLTRSGRLQNQNGKITITVTARTIDKLLTDKYAYNRAWLYMSSSIPVLLLLPDDAGS